MKTTEMNHIFCVSIGTVAYRNVLKVCDAYAYENCNQVILIYIIQMVCGPDFLISKIVAKWPGSVHDFRSFKESLLCREFERV